MRVLLVSCYELGHQPLTLAWPLAFLRRAGVEASSLDLSVEPLDEEKVSRAELVGISVPMHTALRLGVEVARRVRALNPDCHISFYGLYALLNAEYLLSGWADSVLGGEYEERLVELARSLDRRTALSPSGVGVPPPSRWGTTGGTSASLAEAVGEGGGPRATNGKNRRPVLSRLAFPVPAREGLPPLRHYAHLEKGGRRVEAGYVEASRGCLHTCRHCPIPPVYHGRFFVVPRDVVLADIRQQVEAGAAHITFGDPDFLNGPGHSLAVARALHRDFPDLTFDFTAKVEHLLRQRRVLPELRDLGCVFVVSAVESLSNVVLGHLKKGHTREDVLEVTAILREVGIALRPTLVSFTPWTTLRDYREVLDWVAGEGLVDHVDPVQYSIRLLVPPGSALLGETALRPFLGRLVEESFSYEWRHPEPQMDRLYAEVSGLVEKSATEKEDPAVTFARIFELAEGRSVPLLRPERARPPRLTEDWFC